MTDYDELKAVLGPENIAHLFSGLRVAESFVGSVLRWLHQPDVDLTGELRFAEEGIREALRAIGAEPQAIAVQHRREYFDTLKLPLEVHGHNGEGVLRVGHGNDCVGVQFDAIGKGGITLTPQAAIDFGHSLVRQGQYAIAVRNADEYAIEVKNAEERQRHTVSDPPRIGPDCPMDCEHDHAEEVAR